MCDCGTCCDIHGHYDGCNSLSQPPVDDPSDDYNH